MDDEQLAARLAQIPVYCAACGGEFPGTTELHNGICDDCQKLTHGPNYRLIAELNRKAEDLRRAEIAIRANHLLMVEKSAEVERLREAWTREIRQTDALNEKLHDLQEGMRDLVSTLYLYIGHHAETQLTTEQKELLYDVVEASYRAEGIVDEPMERWWRVMRDE